MPDDVYRNARATAAQRGTSVGALVVSCLEQLPGHPGEFGRLGSASSGPETGWPATRRMIVRLADTDVLRYPLSREPLR
jgi:hypothetical protein